MASSQDKDSESSLSNRLELTCISKRYFKKARHTWVIEDFMSRLEASEETAKETHYDTLKSDIFTIPIKVAKGKERKLKFQFEMGLKDSRNDDNVSFYVRCLNPDPPIRAKFGIYMLPTSELGCARKDQLEQKTDQLPAFCTFYPNGTKWGWDKAYYKSDLKKYAEHVTKEGRLTLETNIQIECEYSQEENTVISAPLVQGFLGKRLWDDRDNTGDIILLCGETRFSAHRNVLMASSDVMKAMFQHQTAESETGLVCIRDMSPTCLEGFLHYIYLNKLPLDVNTVDDAEGLLIAAEKYNVIDLKTKCEQKLSTIMNISNAGRVGAIANMHNAAHLHKYVVNYIANNYQEVVKCNNQWDILPHEIIKEALKRSSCQS